VEKQTVSVIDIAMAGESREVGNVIEPTRVPLVDICICERGHSMQIQPGTMDSAWHIVHARVHRVSLCVVVVHLRSFVGFVLEPTK
jgi:hypothetical protein